MGSAQSCTHERLDECDDVAVCNNNAPTCTTQQRLHRRRQQHRVTSLSGCERILHGIGPVRTSFEQNPSTILSKKQQATSRTSSKRASSKSNRSDTNNTNTKSSKKVQFASGTNCANFCKSIGGKLKSPKLVSAAQSLVSGCSSPLDEPSDLCNAGEPIEAVGGLPKTATDAADSVAADNNNDNNSNNKSDVEQSSSALTSSNNKCNDCVTGVPTNTSTGSAAKTEIKRRAKGIQRHLSYGSTSGANYIAKRLPQALVTGAKRMRRKSVAAATSDRAPNKSSFAASAASTTTFRRSNHRAGPIESSDVFIYPTTYRDQNECQKCERDNKICNCNLIEPPPPTSQVQVSETSDKDEDNNQSDIAHQKRTENGIEQSFGANIDESNDSATQALGSSGSLRTTIESSPSQQTGAINNKLQVDQVGRLIGRKAVSERAIDSATAEAKLTTGSETSMAEHKRKQLRLAQAKRLLSLSSFDRLGSSVVHPKAVEMDAGVLQRGDSRSTQIGSTEVARSADAPPPEVHLKPPEPPRPWNESRGLRCESSAASRFTNHLAEYSPILESAKDFIDTINSEVQLARATTTTATATSPVSVSVSVSSQPTTNKCVIGRAIETSGERASSDKLIVSATSAAAAANASSSSRLISCTASTALLEPIATIAAASTAVTAITKQHNATATDTTSKQQQLNLIASNPLDTAVSTIEAASATTICLSSGVSIAAVSSSSLVATSAAPTPLLTASTIEVKPGTLESPKERSIFEGASKDEILEYLEYARERVPEVLIAADEVMVINENELIVVNQLEPGSPATPISIVEQRRPEENAVGSPTPTPAPTSIDLIAPAVSSQSALSIDPTLLGCRKEDELELAEGPMDQMPSAHQSLSQQLENLYHASREVNLHFGAPPMTTAAELNGGGGGGGINQDTQSIRSDPFGAQQAKPQISLNFVHISSSSSPSNSNATATTTTMTTTTCAGRDSSNIDENRPTISFDDDMIAHLSEPKIDKAHQNGGHFGASIEEASILAAMKDLNLRCTFEDSDPTRRMRSFATNNKRQPIKSKRTRAAASSKYSAQNRNKRIHKTIQLTTSASKADSRKSLSNGSANLSRHSSNSSSIHFSMRPRSSSASSSSAASSTANMDAITINRASTGGQLSTSAASSTSLSTSSNSSGSSTTTSSLSSSAVVDGCSPLEQASSNCGARSNLYASPALSCSSPYLAIVPASGPNSLASQSSADEQIRPLVDCIGPLSRSPMLLHDIYATIGCPATSRSDEPLIGYMNAMQVQSNVQSMAMSPEMTLSSACGSPAPLVERGDSGLGSELHHLHTPTDATLGGGCGGGGPYSPNLIARDYLADSSGRRAADLIAKNEFFDGPKEAQQNVAKLDVIEELSNSADALFKSAQSSPTPPTKKFNGQSSNFLRSTAAASNLLSPINLLSKSSHCHYAILIRLNNYFASYSQSSCDPNRLGMESQCIDCDQFIVMDPTVVANRIQKIRSLLGPNFSTDDENFLMDNGSIKATKKQQLDEQQPIKSSDNLPTLEQIDEAYIAAINELPLCKACEKRRAERKEIISEFAETEFKYGRDLKIILNEFYRPMQIAGLLSKDQINGIFLNLEELIMAHCRFFDRLSTAINEAQSLKDKDLTIVNIGKIFVESAEMLHTFESYCIRQGSAACLLARLAKEKELLRIFLRVSQMENTLLRRMNLAAFLMVPVQRVTRYPLLLNRLYKVTPYHHRDREALRDAQLKVELHLEHINQQTKGIGASNKIWRRFSNLSTPATSNRRGLLNTEDISYIKMRNTALDILKWHRDDAQFIHSGVLSFSPLNEYLVRQKTKSLRFITAHALLIVLGKPNWKYRPDLVKSTLDNKLATPTPGGNGIKEAALLLFREKNSRFVLCREPLILSNSVLSNDCSHLNSECPSSQQTASNQMSANCNGSGSSGSSNINSSSNNNSNNHPGNNQVQHSGRQYNGPKSASTSTTSNAGFVASESAHTGYSNGNRKSLPGRLQTKEIDSKPMNAFEASHSCFASSMQVDPTRSSTTPTSVTSVTDCGNNNNTSNNRLSNGSARTNSDTNSEGECAILNASTAGSNHSRSDTISMSSLKNSPDDYTISTTITPHPISPPHSSIAAPAMLCDEFSSHQALRSNSLVAQLSRSPVTTMNSTTNLIKSTSTTSSNLAIINSLMTKVNNYHKNCTSKQAAQQQQSSLLRPSSPAPKVSPPKGAGKSKQPKTPQFESLHSRSSTNIASSGVTCASDCGSLLVDPSPIPMQHQQLNSTLNRSNEYQADAFRSVAYNSYGSNSGDNSNSNNNTIALTQQQHQSIRPQYNHHFFHNHSHQAYGDYEESFEIHDRLSKESLLLRADTPSKTRYWLQMLRYHAKDLGHWRFRRNGLANIMIMHQE